jgi:hypothetical protein
MGKVIEESTIAVPDTVTGVNESGLKYPPP